MRLLVIFLVACIVGIAGPASAEFSAPPNQACSYLNGTGIHTRGYKDLGGQWGCSSPYFEMGGSPIPNNVAYYVSGTSNQATQLRLVLNVNSRAEETSARLSFFLYANALFKKALGIKLPKKLETAIEDGKPATWSKDKTQAKLIRTDWPTEKGYSLKLVVE